MSVSFCWELLNTFASNSFLHMEHMQDLYKIRHYTNSTYDFAQLLSIVLIIAAHISFYFLYRIPNYSVIILLIALFSIHCQFIL